MCVKMHYAIGNNLLKKYEYQFSILFEKIENSPSLYWWYMLKDHLKLVIM